MENRRHERPRCAAGRAIVALIRQIADGALHFDEVVCRGAIAVRPDLDRKDLAGLVIKGVHETTAIEPDRVNIDREISGSQRNVGNQINGNRPRYAIVRIKGIKIARGIKEIDQAVAWIIGHITAIGRPCRSRQNAHRHWICRIADIQQLIAAEIATRHIDHDAVWQDV